MKCLALSALLSVLLVGTASADVDAGLAACAKGDYAAGLRLKPRGIGAEPTGPPPMSPLRLRGDGPRAARIR